MKRFNLLFISSLIMIAVVFVTANLVMRSENNESGRPYRVEINRLENDMREGKETDVSSCRYVTAVVRFDGQDDFYSSNSDYVIKDIGGTLYRFDYSGSRSADRKRIISVNIIIAVLGIFIVCLLLYIRKRILLPFNKFSSVPYDLSKGKLTDPLEENKSRYFGKFVWGVNMLRENMLEQKEQELRLLSERQTLILSISHDIKTPLSAIKLYSKAMSKGLYTDRDKLIEVAKSIDKNADDIEKFVNDLTRSASGDFMELEVDMGEVYLSQILNEIIRHYTPVLNERHTDFSADKYIDCLLGCDKERSIEVLKNLMDNAVKYGYGKYIRIGITEEDGCRLVCVANSGCSLPANEMLHIFDSFWRGSNAGKKGGSGLGLYICKQLMLKMNGDIFAEQADGEMRITAVFPKA